MSDSCSGSSVHPSTNIMVESFEPFLYTLIPFMSDVDSVCVLASLNRESRDAIVAFLRSNPAQPLMLMRNDSNINILRKPIGRCILRNTRRLVISAADSEFLYKLLPSLQTSGAHVLEVELIDCSARSVQIFADLINSNLLRKLSFQGCSTLSTSDARGLVRRLSYRNNYETVTLDIKKAQPLDRELVELQRLHTLARSVGVIIEA